MIRKRVYIIFSRFCCFFVTWQKNTVKAGFSRAGQETWGEIMFNPQQIQTLRAATDRIIPADDYPSGWEAGVGDFLLRLLALEPRFLPLYQNGLDALESEAQAASGQTSFAALAAAAQDALLARLEEEGSEFFGVLVQQVIEGYYADPGNGGNKDGAAWEMIGFRVTG